MHILKITAFLLILVIVMAGGPAEGMVNVFNFDSDNSLSGWKIGVPGQDTLKLSKLYATSGSNSLEYHTPAWKTGMPEWPSFETAPAVKDWNSYDRIVVDITNPGATAPRFWAFLSDSKTPFRSGVQYAFDLPERGFKRYVIDISKFPATLDKSDMSIVHLFTERPEETRLYISSVIMLRPGEQLPVISQAFLKQIVQISKSKLKDTEKVVSKCEADAGEGSQWAVELKNKVRELKTSLNSTELSQEKLASFSEQADAIIARAERVSQLVKMQRSCEKSGLPAESMLVGWASSTEKILPREMPFLVNVSKSVSVSAARNEKESFQIAVTPSGPDKLRGVSVSASDLRGRNASILSASNINCDVVGYVQTKVAPPYAVPYVGWWPDPILNFLGPIDIASGDIQTFWIRVRVPKGQNPGLYKGSITISAAGSKPVKLGLNVRVRSFTMPDCTPLPTAITFLVPEYKSRIINEICGADKWNAKLKYDYADFLADYYIDYDSLYESAPPDYEVLKYLHDKNKLVAFNYGYFGGDPQSNVERFKPIYEKCKEMGIIDHSYIYGFDESPADGFPALESAVKAIKDAFPDVMTMTTAYDHTFGVGSVVKSMDAWCPLTPSFDPKQASLAREQGKKVWWYICCGPQHPYANWFIEYPAIEARLLMGAMTAKYNPDGFLYYSMTYWNANEPITSGPFTKWNPVSWTTFDGDGSIICCGPGGSPVPTIRLENYRDGMEDFAYAKILETIISKYQARGGSLNKRETRWLADAQAAITVPDKLVKDMATYSRDSGVLYSWRDKMADLIDSSGMSDVDPWGNDFGVRGFANK